MSNMNALLFLQMEGRRCVMLSVGHIMITESFTPMMGVGSVPTKDSKHRRSTHPIMLSDSVDTKTLARLRI